MRPGRFAFAVAAVLAALATGANASASTGPERQALASYALMQRYFYVGSAHAYNAVYPGKGHAQLWPYSQALASLIAVAELPHHSSDTAADLRSRLHGLDVYRVRVSRGLAYAPLYGGRGNPFYDDNVWVGLDYLAAANVLHSPLYLAHAQSVLDWIETGWDTRAARCRGGVYWLMPGGKYWRRSPGSRYRAAVSTVNAVQLAVALYEKTGATRDLLWGERAYDWTQRCLRLPNGLIADHVDAAGVVTRDIHSYNQGSEVAAALELFHVTHARTYLAAARRTATAALALFRVPQPDGDEAPLLAIFYRDLGGLTGLAGLREATTAFASAAWSNERDPSTGLYRFGHTHATLLDQAAMVQVYSALALLDQPGNGRPGP